MKKILLYIVVGLFILISSSFISANVEDFTYADVGSTGDVINSFFNNTGYYNFNGVNSYINSNNDDYSENGSVSLWIKTENNNTDKRLVQRTGGNRPSIIMDDSGSGKVKVYFFNGSVVFSVISDDPLNDGLFHNVVFTWNDNDTISLYVDGILDQQASISGSLDIDSGNWFIGRQGTQDLGYFNGSIDEVRLYNKTLELSEVQSINSSSNIKNDSLGFSSLINYYSFNVGGLINIFNISSEINKSSLNSLLNFTDKLTNISDNIFEIYGDISINNVSTINLSNVEIKLYSIDDYHSDFDLESNNIFLENFTSYSYNGTSFYDNITNINSNGRSRILINNSILNMINSNITYLGEYTDSALNVGGFVCNLCYNSSISSNSFSFNILGPTIRYGNNVTFYNNNIFNSSSNGTKASLGLWYDFSNNSIIESNNIYNIYSGRGWNLDDSSNLFIAHNSYNIMVKNNNISNGETGISVWDSSVNISIFNNTINNTLGSGIKYEKGIKNSTISFNIITNGGDTKFFDSEYIIRPSIEISGTDIRPTNNIIKNNVMSNYVLFSTVEFSDETEIFNNVIFNNSNNNTLTSVKGSIFWFFNTTNISFYNNSVKEKFNVEDLSIKFSSNVNISIEYENYTDITNSNLIEDINIKFILNDFNFFTSHLNSSSLNITRDYLKLKNTNQTNSILFELYELTNSLIYYSNNSIAGDSDVELNDNNINISLTPQNSSFILNNYNLTLGQSNRENDPIFNGTSNLMNNTLSDTITFKVFGGTPLISNGIFTNGIILSDSEFTIPSGSKGVIT